MKLYLAGPMRGYPEFNFPAFLAAAEDLRWAGHDVISPAEHDIELAGSYEAATDTNQPLDLRQLLSWDLAQVAGKAHAVAVLPGWEDSVGASLEVSVARGVGIPVYELAHVPHEARWRIFGILTDEPKSIIDCGEKTKYTDPETGGSKEESEARFDLVPPDAHAELAKVYGYGEGKYPSGPDGPNYLRGYPWHLSIASAERHIAKFKAGEDFDPESGKHHLSHAAWHMLTLIAFQLRGLGTDDRKKLTRSVRPDRVRT